MKKNVTLGDKSFDIECNAAVPIFCKRTFKINPMQAFTEMAESNDISEKIETLEKIGFIMAMTATKKLEDMYTLTELDFIRWLSDFEWDDIASEPFLNAVTELWARDNAQDSQPKN